MTRKLKFLFALLIPFCFSLNAQAQFAIGTKMLGLNLGYSSKLLQENGVIQNENTSTLVSPEVYFFPIENFAIGGSFLIMKQEISSMSGNLKTLEELTSKGLTLGGRIFTKGDHAFKFYVNPALVMIFSDGQNLKGTTLESTVRVNSGGFVLGSGFIYMVNKTMGLNFSTGPLVSFLGSSSTTVGNGNNNPVINSYSDFKIMPNGLSNLTVGFSYIF